LGLFNRDNNRFVFNTSVYDEYVHGYIVEKQNYKSDFSSTHCCYNITGILEMGVDFFQTVVFGIRDNVFN